jgi:hypothetical protein
MTRTLDSLQEVGFHCDNGKTLRAATLSAEIAMIITRRYEKDELGRERPADYLARMTFRAARTDDVVAIYERPFASLEEIAALFGIDDLEEVWEVLSL